MEPCQIPSRILPTGALSASALGSNEVDLSWGSASDNVGVSSVAFTVTGAGSASGPLEDAASPYDLAVITGSTAAPGSTIVVRATARDAAGNSAEASATIAIVDAEFGPALAVYGSDANSLRSFVQDTKHLMRTCTEMFDNARFVTVDCFGEACEHAFATA